MYLCQVCFHSWRSTEPTYAVDAEALSKDFRIDPSVLSKGQVMPEIPRSASTNDEQRSGSRLSERLW